MNNNCFIRFALMLNDNQAETFNSNLNKMIQLALFSKKNELLTISQIITVISRSFSLEFTYEEIYNVIRKQKKSEIIANINSNDDYMSTYSLKSEYLDKIAKKQDNLKLGKIVNRFVVEFQDYKDKSDVVCETILKFLYTSFNNDVQTLLHLMDKQIQSKSINSVNWGIDDISLINSFLNWDDKEKNNFIYNSISSCYEYCMMTVRKDNSSFSNIFKGKIFYLDANIIFRLAGVNSVARQEVLEAFINKSISVGIKLKYTNFTADEINTTIETKVKQLKAMLNNSSPISVESYKSMIPTANTDFYAQYVEWTINSTHNTGDFLAFQKYLKRKVDKQLQRFSYQQVSTYNGGKQQPIFNDLCESFQKYKVKRYKNPYEKAIMVDINNYLHILSLNNEVSKNSFYDVNNYFITADHSLCEWATQQQPGAIPKFLLPSVWYSLILKFGGRSDDDYSAFCQFLNMRTPSIEDNDIEIKKRILVEVIGLDESVKVKEEIIFSINEQLKNANNIINVDEIIKKTHSSITQKYVNNAVDTERRTYDTLLDAERQKKDIEVKNALNKGIEKGQQKLLLKIATRKAKIRHNIKSFIYISFCIAIVITIIFMVVACQSGKITLANNSILSFFKNNAWVISLCSLVYAVLSKIFASIIKHFDLLNEDINKIIQRIDKNYTN